MSPLWARSGSGKTTLLNILAALDRPTDGSVLLDGKDLSAVREQEAAAFRREQLGFVFQEFNLLDTFTIEDNIYLPLVLAGKRYEDMRERLLPLALELGISELLKKYPYEVSGGQKQRAAVARALITNPRLILADEPTGALDSRATDELLRLFADVNRRGPDHPDGDALGQGREPRRAGCCSSATARSITSSTAARTVDASSSTRRSPGR